MTDPSPPRLPWIRSTWEQAVATHPEHPALEGEGRVLTLGELDRKVTVLAEAITAASPDPRVPVAAVLESRVDAVVAAYAGWKAGRPFSQIAPESPPQRVEELVGLVGARAVVTDPGRAGSLGGATVVDPAALPAEPTGAALHVQSDDDDGTLTFTSGSTGRPKGVVSSVGANTFRSQVLHQVYGFGPHDRVGLTLAPSFGAASFVFPTPVHGGTLCLRDPTTGGAAALAEWIEAERITLLVVTPVLLREVLERLSPGEHLPHLRIVAPLGEKVLGADVRAVRARCNPRVRIVGQFGATEVGPATVFDIGPDDDVPDGILPVGVPFPGVDVRIAEPDDSGAGKIEIRSPGVFTRYWDDPGLTAAVLRPDPEAPGRRVLVTGDVGKILPNGQLVFMGRRDAMVKVRGLSIDLSEVERRLTGLPEVREAIVSVDEPRPDRRRIVAHVVAAQDGLTVSALRRALGEQLPAYMLPSAVVLCEAFPRSDRGKVIVEQLPPVAPGRPLLDVPYVEPPPGTPALVARQFSAVLDVDAVGLDDDFFELGGDSLAVVEVVDRLSQHLGVPVTSRVFGVPTVRAVAARCDELRAGERPSSLVPLSTTGEGVPLFLVHGAGGLAESLQELADEMATIRPVYGLEPVDDDDIARLGSFPRTAEAYAEAITAAHPSGPLLVGGLSGGGIIAMEVARRLAERGRRPGAVVLLDTVALGLSLPLRRHGHLDRARARRWWSRRIAIAKREALLWSWSVPALARVVPARGGTPRREHDALTALRSGRPLAADQRRAHLEAMMLRGSRRWIARPYAGRVVVVRASEPRLTDPWRDVARDLVVVDVPGDHESFVRPPQVSVLVERLEDVLTR